VTVAGMRPGKAAAGMGCAVAAAGRTVTLTAAAARRDAVLAAPLVPYCAAEDETPKATNVAVAGSVAAA
jgi:hypothetical protein